MKTIKIVSLIFIALITFSSCNQIAQQKNKADAKAEKVHGLYIFIKSKPVGEYTFIDNLDRDALAEISGSIKDKKKGLDILGEIFNNLTFREQVEKMAELASEKYEGADALIFSDQMTSCEVVSLKE